MSDQLTNDDTMQALIELVEAVEDDYRPFGKRTVLALQQAKKLLPQPLTPEQKLVARLCVELHPMTHESIPRHNCPIALRTLKIFRDWYADGIAQETNQ